MPLSDSADARRDAVKVGPLTEEARGGEGGVARGSKGDREIDRDRDRERQRATEIERKRDKDRERER